MGTKHTPTPWLSKSDTEKSKQHNMIMGPSGYTVAHILTKGKDAEFIVRAVNSYQSNIDLIQDLLALVKGSDHDRSSIWATDKIMKAEKAVQL